MRRRHVRVADLLAMASTASAMSLSNFQIITSSQVPLACILAYNAPILGCSNADFTSGNTCSAGCVRALQRIEDALASVCGDANVPSTSLLGQALSGGLVEKLCPSGQTTTTTTSRPSVSQSSTAAIVITQTTRQIGTFSPIPTPTPSTLQTSTTTTSSSSTEEDSDTEAQTSTSSPESEPQPTETTETTQTTQVAPAPIVTSSVGGSPTQTTGAQQTKAPPQTTSDNVPGGGSPFDVATVVSGSQRLTARWLEGFLIANFFFFLLWR